MSKEKLEGLNTNNNVLTSKGTRVFKRRNVVKAAVAATSLVGGTGVGIGVGYAIFHNNQTNHTPIYNVVFNTGYSASMDELGSQTIQATARDNSSVTLSASGNNNGNWVFTPSTTESGKGVLEYTEIGDEKITVTITATNDNDESDSNSIKIDLLPQAPSPMPTLKHYTFPEDYFDQNDSTYLYQTDEFDEIYGAVYRHAITTESQDLIDENFYLTNQVVDENEQQIEMAQYTLSYYGSSSSTVNDNLWQVISAQDDTGYLPTEPISQILFNPFIRVKVNIASIKILVGNEKVGDISFVNDKPETLTTFGQIVINLNTDYTFYQSDKSIGGRISLYADGYPLSASQGDYQIRTKDGSTTLANINYYVENAGSLSIMEGTVEKVQLQWDSGNSNTPFNTCVGGAVSINYNSHNNENDYGYQIMFFKSEDDFNSYLDVSVLEAFREMVNNLYDLWVEEPTTEHWNDYLNNKNNYDLYSSLFNGNMVEISESNSIQYAIIDNYDEILNLIKDRATEN